MYYIGDPNLVYYDANLKMIMSFDQTTDPSVVHRLPYYLAIYKPTGEFVSFRPLESEFILCPHSANDAINAKSFGLNFNLECTINIENFLLNYQSYVYELFLRDTDNTYYPIPILIGNYRSSKLFSRQFYNRGRYLP